MSAWAEDVRHRRDGPRGKLHCSAYLSFQSGRAGRKVHFAAACSLGFQIITDSDHWHWHDPPGQTQGWPGAASESAPSVAAGRSSESRVSSRARRGVWLSESLASSTRLEVGP